MDHQYIAIAGNIGAGKSTLTRMLAQTFGWQPFYEANAENPYLADFYQDMTRWSFQSQVFFLGKRLEHHRQLVDYPGNVIQDRTVYEDAEIFATNLYHQGAMTARDFETYQSLYKAISAFLPPPDLIIYLQADVEKLLRHIALRGRAFEQNIAPSYIQQLNDLYEDWINRWTSCPVLRIPMKEINFQHNPDHFETVTKTVKTYLPQRIGQNP